LNAVAVGQTAISRQPRPKLGAWHGDLDRMLSDNEARPARERLTLIRVFEELRGLGYEGARMYSKDVAPDRRTFRTVFRDSCSSRAICLIDLPLTQYSRLIRPIVSTTTIPATRSASQALARRDERVCRDSPLEGGGFEPSVPRRRPSPPWPPLNLLQP
jgi:hypothetical protein